MSELRPERLQAILREVAKDRGPSLSSESDIVIWFCHYLIADGFERFKSESGPRRYDLEVRTPGKVFICEFKYAWDGWPTSEIEKDRGKLLEARDKKMADEIFFFLAYREIFAKNAGDLEERFRPDRIYSEVVLVPERRGSL